MQRWAVQRVEERGRGRKGGKAVEGVKGTSMIPHEEEPNKGGYTSTQTTLTYL